MNMFDCLQESIQIGDREVPINTDFHTGILVDQCLNDRELDDLEKLETVLMLYLGEDIAEIRSQAELEQAFAEVMKFYRCEGSSKVNPNTRLERPSEPVFDYDYDAGYIFSAFQTAYNIDLTTTQLHWWKFQSLLLSLPEDTQFMKIVEYRSYKPSSSMSKEQKRFYEKKKRMYALPIDGSEKDATDELTRALMNGESLSGKL